MVVTFVIVFLAIMLSKTIMDWIVYYKAVSIYQRIESDLKEEQAENPNNIEFGFSERDITERYRSGDSETYFEKTVMPYLEKLRKKNGKIKKFAFRDQGRDSTKWQFTK